MQGKLRSAVRQRIKVVAACFFCVAIWTPSIAPAKTVNHPSRGHQVREVKLVGAASFYGKKFHGRRTASGEVFNNNALTAAHRTLPFGTKVKVTSVRSGLSVIVRINDRGPFIAGRIIDLSRAAAQKIGLLHRGISTVRLEILS
jgi:rare lipoprotein A